MNQASQICLKIDDKTKQDKSKNAAQVFKFWSQNVIQRFENEAADNLSHFETCGEKKK